MTQSSKPLILVVDDEAYIAELLSELLQDEIECIVRTAFNGMQALSMVHEEPPALIITDLMMPYMDGQSFVRALRSEASVIPIITMSAARQRPTWVQEEKLAFIAKPFEPLELIDAVTTMLAYLDQPSQRSVYL